MPALANMIRNGEEWAALRSKITKTFSSIASLVTTRSRTTVTKSTEVSNSSYGPYSTLDEAHELKGVNTSIVHGTSSIIENMDDDGIHLKYGFTQEFREHGFKTADMSSPV
jgi:hypothetical protein